MCDYSLYALPNRLAEDGEQVVLYKFATGTIGFASVLDAARMAAERRSRWQAFCGDLKAMLLPRASARVPAVCMPPGTRLTVSDIPAQPQAMRQIRPGDTVTVTEINTQSYAYRDALILPNGTCVLLQDLPVGVQATVLSTAVEPLEENVYAYAHSR